MILQQHYLGCLAQASYLLGDEETRTAVVVDPRRDVGVYLEEAAKLGLGIRLVILTHFHADFLAGHLELRARTGAEIALGARATAEFPFRRLRDGEELRFGDLRLEILETPGHTPEGICILVHDERAGLGRPHAILTGDTLFNGDVGRPDLLASVGFSSEELAGMMYDSLQAKILPLHDDVLVYPGHGAGSACGRSLSTETVSTIGAQRRSNPALQPMSREDFVAQLTAPMAAPPTYFAFDAQQNRKQRLTLEESLKGALRPLSLDELLQHANAGAVVLDVRDPGRFAAAHLAGSLNIGLGGKYATWAGTLLAPETPIVLVAEPGGEAEAATRLGRIGYDRVLGFLQGGPSAFADRSELVARTGRLDVGELARRLSSPAPPRVLDVRAPTEHAAGHIEGSLLIPLPNLAARAAEIPTDRPLVILCAGGYRSMIASSILLRAALPPHSDLIGGFAAWREAGHPIAVPAAT